MSIGAKIALGIIVGFCIITGGCFTLATFIWNNAKPNINLNENSGAAQSSPTPPSPEQHWDSTNAKIEAFVMSQTFMKRRLKSPSTADFPWYTDSEVAVKHRGGGVFLVNSYVDAQNSFGAKLRTHYSCTLKDNGNESWSLISLNTH